MPFLFFSSSLFFSRSKCEENTNLADCSRYLKMPFSKANLPSNNQTLKGTKESFWITSFLCSTKLTQNGKLSGSGILGFGSSLAPIWLLSSFSSHHIWNSSTLTRSLVMHLCAAWWVEDNALIAKDGHQGIIKGQPSGQKPFVLEEKQLKCPTRSMWVPLLMEACMYRKVDHLWQLSQRCTTYHKSLS